MYANPDKFGLIDGRNCLQRTNNVTSIHNFLFGLVHSEKVRLEGGDWIISRENIDDLHRLDMLSCMGITYEKYDGDVIIKSGKYPLFLKYFYMCHEASLRRKVNCFSYVMSCDFRIFNKKFGLKLDDILRVLSDKDKAYVLELNNYLLTRGIKPKPRIYFSRISYEYNNQPILNIEILGWTYLFFQVSLGKNHMDGAYSFIVSEIEKSPDKDELGAYLLKNITCCNLCFGNKPLKNRCDRWVDILGHRRLICFEFCLSNKKKSERNIMYRDYDIYMLKRFMELRLMSLNNPDK